MNKYVELHLGFSAREWTSRFQISRRAISIGCLVVLSFAVLLPTLSPAQTAAPLPSRASPQPAKTPTWDELSSIDTTKEAASAPKRQLSSTGLSAYLVFLESQSDTAPKPADSVTKPRATEPSKRGTLLERLMDPSLTAAEEAQFDARSKAELESLDRYKPPPSPTDPTGKANFYDRSQNQAKTVNNELISEKPDWWKDMPLADAPRTRATPMAQQKELQQATPAASTEFDKDGNFIDPIGGYHLDTDGNRIAAPKSVGIAFPTLIFVTILAGIVGYLFYRIRAGHYVSHGGMMNRNQQIAVAASAAGILLMLIFPPFHVQLRGTTFNMGYGFILDPPQRGYVAASVNVGMLLVQWVGALLFTALAFFMLKSSGESDRPSAEFLTAIPLSTGDLKHDVAIDQSKNFLGGQHHPWRRLFARTVDVATVGLLLLLLIAFAVGATMPTKAEGFAKVLENPIIAGFLLYFVFFPTEAMLLSLFGTTPAKWLFGIRVAHPNGALLSFTEALHRSFLVWIQGVGLGIPFVALFTQLFAYRRLTKTGTTLWDTSTSSVVSHRPWGVLRTVMCVTVVFAVLFLMGILSAVGNRPHG